MTPPANDDHLPDGIYFGLDEEAYHAHPALGSGDIKRLYISPIQWQFERLRDFRASIGLGDDEDAEDSAAKRFGKAVHTMVLEGPEVFAARHCVEPTPPEGLLKTVEEMRDAIRESGLTPPTDMPAPSKWKRPDFVHVCRALGIGPLSDDWADGRERVIAGREVVSERWFATIRLIGSMLDAERASLGGKSIRSAVLTGGHPEVSVIWTADDGVRLKARFDYLRIKASVDVKTFACPDGREVIDAFASAVHRFGYDMQAAHYGLAREAIPALVEAGAVYRGPGEEPQSSDLTFIRRVAEHPKAAWTWVTIQTVGCPEVDVCELPSSSLVLASAQCMVRDARDAFRRYRDRFGDDALWVEDRGLIRMEDVVFSPSITSRGAKRWEQAA
ncbi:hypothetical protein [Brevundimonas balnearis]|uniref:Uncharacterized protein n=1 Tax=Brevundimonas balnearis TaxID=1572858 RepID=A0ABV6R0V1_9CAUL